MHRFKFVSQAATKENQKTRDIMTKKVKRGEREFQDLVDEMVVDLVQQDMEKAGEEARRKAVEEHKVCYVDLRIELSIGIDRTSTVTHFLAQPSDDRSHSAVQKPA